MSKVIWHVTMSVDRFTTSPSGAPPLTAGVKLFGLPWARPIRLQQQAA
jgi:hypothetical protein